MKHFYCGIDPGLSGAIALLDDCGHIIGTEDMPVLQLGTRRVLDLGQLRVSLQQLLPRLDRVSVALEEVSGHRPLAPSKDGTERKSGGVGMFRFGRAVGNIEGMLAMAGYSITPVLPQSWKKAMMAGMPKDKDASRLRCSQLWPAETGRWTRKKDHARCDALLIAEWLRRHEMGTSNAVTGRRRIEER